MHASPCPSRLAAALVALAALLIGAPPAGAQAPAAQAFITRSADQAPRALGPDVLRERRVTLDPLAMGGPATAPAERVVLDLFADVAYVAVQERVVRHDSGLTWHGRLEGLPLSSVVFAVTGGAFAGHISSPLGQFVLTQAPGGVYVVRQVTFDTPRPDDAVRPPADAAGAVVLPDREPGRRPADAAAAVIDLLVVYSTAARVEAGGAGPLEAAIHVAAGLTDTALRAAGTGGLRLAGMREAGYAASDIFASLQHVQDGTDGLLDEVHALRDQHSADLVALVTDFTGSDYCGLGYISPGIPDFAYTVVQGVSCLNGLILAHEVGHNLGLHHDWFTTADGGLRPSSKGYISLAGRFGTVMAYADHCVAAGVSCSQIARFSNPSATHEGFATGVPVGTSTACTAGTVNNPPCDADAAATLAESVPIAAAYRLSDRLTAGQALEPRQSIAAQGVSCRLEYQGDGNLVAYDGGTPYYASATADTTPGRAVMQADGNFVIYDAADAPVWATGTGGNPGAFLVIQSDCNVVLYSGAGAPLWASGTP